VTREEHVTLEAYRALTPVAAEAGGAVVMQVPQAPDSPMLNRAVGLGAASPATEDDVDAVLAAFEGGVTYYVAVSPSARPDELPRWLAARGLQPGWGWRAFTRGVDAPERRATPLTLREVADDEDAASFARIVRVGYELPEAIEPVVARAPAAGWRCWLALDGDEPASAAAMYVAEDVAYLGFAATLPEHRGKGAQNALLAERIEQAAASGCDLVLTETGERRDDLPSNSYRNILRAGFREAGVTANWLGRS
jgi:ribosomal protein S18 acetylase RimI-like enzyme